MRFLAALVMIAIVIGLWTAIPLIAALVGTGISLLILWAILKGLNEEDNST
jgi:divalent metal cation (Fe/Co/Zn/Cd) transporter